VKLTVRQAAAMLGVPETRVYRWVDEDEIPFVMLHQQPRFHRLELLEWAMDNELPLTVDLYEAGSEGPLAEALERGGGHALAGAVSDLVRHLPIASEPERDWIGAVLPARARVAFVHLSAAGIALQRPHSPLICPKSPPTVTLCWCDPAVPLGDKAASTVFLVVAPTTEQHLQLLSRLSLALHDGALRAAAVRKHGFDHLLSEVRRWEAM
jgi:excisionase family DNA binding protein